MTKVLGKHRIVFEIPYQGLDCFPYCKRTGRNKIVLPWACGRRSRGSSQIFVITCNRKRCVMTRVFVKEFQKRTQIMSIRENIEKMMLKIQSDPDTGQTVRE